MKAFLSLSLILLIAAASCKKSKTPEAPQGEPEIEVQTILNNYEIIWGMDVLPSGDLLFGEKRGRLYIWQSNTNTVAEINGLPPIDAGGQGGLLDVRLHPNYASNGWIYISYTSSNPYYALKVSRFKVVNNKIEQLQHVFTAAGPGGHNGSRIAFDKNGLLYVSVGEGPSTGGGPNVANTNASNPSSFWGKIHRMNDDGTIPASNPIIPGNAARNSIFSIGHRNPQGLVIHPQTGELWASEHGPLGGDEINIIRSGNNYGWPLYSLGRNYDGSVISNGHTATGITPPIYSWIPSIGTCGIVFIKGTKFKSWTGNLLVAGLASQKLHRCIIRNNEVASEQIMIQNQGRVRNVIQAPDETIYVSVEGPGRILKITAK